MGHIHGSEDSPGFTTKEGETSGGKVGSMAVGGRSCLRRKQRFLVYTAKSTHGFRQSRSTTATSISKKYDKSSFLTVDLTGRYITLL